MPRGMKVTRQSHALLKRVEEASGHKDVAGSVAFGEAFRALTAYVRALEEYVTRTSTCGASIRNADEDLAYRVETIMEGTK